MPTLKKESDFYIPIPVQPVETSKAEVDRYFARWKDILSLLRHKNNLMLAEYPNDKSSKITRQE